MKTKFSILKQTGIFAVASAIMLLSHGESQALTTAAGTAIANTVTVGWQSTGGTGYTATASVTLTVNLVKAAPVLSFISQTPDATAATGSPVDEKTAVTLKYGIYAQANGAVQYKVNAPGYTDATISGEATGTLPANFYLGASSVAYPALETTSDIYVPFDGSDDGIIGGVNGFSASAGNNQLYINGNVYTISSITEDTASDGILPADYKGKFAKITLSAPLSSGTNLYPGDLLPEYKTFNFDVTTGVIISPASTGKHDVTLTVQDDASTPNVSNTASTDINVARCILSITKEISLDNGGSYLASPQSSDPGKDLYYRITVTNSSTKSCKNVSVTDVLSPYIAFNAAAPTYDNGTTTELGAVTFTYYNQSNTDITSSPGLVSGAGNAPGGFDATVSSFKATFPADTKILASESFNLIYKVRLY